MVSGEAMVWETIDRRHSECLLDCLRQVQLQQFAGNLATRGVTDCTKLAALERQQFATYGITSAADVRRLTKLITVIRNLRRGAQSKPGGETSVHDDCRLTTERRPEARCQRKQFASRQIVDDTVTRPKTAVPHVRRPSRDAQQRPRRVMKRAVATGHSVNAENDYDGPIAFTPRSQRTVSPLPTHVQKVR